MPELLEVERYREVAVTTIGRRITSVHAPDPWFLKGGLDADGLRAAAVGTTVAAVRRHGKVLLVTLDSEAVLGLRFGMTGRLVVDGRAPIEALEYGPAIERPEWDRVTLEFAEGGPLRLNDPRRLGGVELDPDLRRLGPDAWGLGLSALRRALAGTASPVKAVLLDQSRIAGLGNLLTDEILWRAGLDPVRPAGGLTEVELRRLQRAIRTTLPQLYAQGGSHTGVLQAERHDDGRCPRDGAVLVRRTIGGRTTRSCPVHQR
ncbi:MAG: DNA-formamidopyrimidine glycosylase family protein [Acidimicrobiales bacterium]